ncbi:hypothetical protein PILCRDRAFT_15473 [Piloderma croceum F 1598]|uniref:Uncharacterized protein n=1 Tax=Piloderma croceum (strain F 1598) TaxID=765440 RepID=A0A0C3EZM9_PILCF|nr:hypothetical protein PILCRDRAFT_15473 [Piloderma croceum F 1598]
MSCDEGFMGISVPSMEQQLVDGRLYGFNNAHDDCQRRWGPVSDVASGSIENPVQLPRDIEVPADVEERAHRISVEDNTLHPQGQSLRPEI